MTMNFVKTSAIALMSGLLVGGVLFASPVHAQYRQKIGNDMSKCGTSGGPAVKITIRGIDGSSGRLRVQSYNGTKEDWLKSGRWLNRIESSAQAGTMTFCMPVAKAGSYAIAVRHDKNGNGKTDLRSDGGGMSGNPSINIFNLGKPSYTKTRFEVGEGVTPYYDKYEIYVISRHCAALSRPGAIRRGLPVPGAFPAMV